MNITECKKREKIFDQLLKLKVNEETDEYENPDAHVEIQNVLGWHLTECGHPECRESRKARIEAGIMSSEGDYLL